MKKLFYKNKGITLVSLVITIIIMLILAGVSLSMVTGDTSVLTQAKKTAFMQEIAGYKEELAISYLGDAAKAQKKIDKSTITARDESTLKSYIPSIKDEDLDDYMIIAGELYYVGDDEFEISVCKEQGYITKPEGMSKDDFYLSLENSALEAILKQLAGKVITEYNEETEEDEVVGVQLAKKNADVGFGTASSGWTIITELDENKNNVATYADGWYYVEAGKSIPRLGPLSQSYIINYSTNKAVRFDSSKHVILSSGGNLAVTEGLVYNADPTNMDGSTNSWGNAVLNGFSGTVKEGNKVISGWTDTAFVTDGEDDYVSLKGKNETYENGVTIEFYGKVPDVDQNIAQNQGGRIHLFAKGIGYSNAVVLGWWDSSQAFWFGYGGHRFWKAPETMVENKDIYVALRADSTNYEGVIKLNNEDLPYQTSSGFTWNGLLTNLNKTNNDFIFGRGIDARGEAYTALEIYSIRVYNRFLSEDELTANYNASVSYHNILVGGGAADNNNTGGTDLDELLGNK